MPTLYITEGRGSSGNFINQVAKRPGIVTQTVAISGASTQSVAFSPNTTQIRVHTDAICSLNIGGISPVATTASERMPADTIEYFEVTPGDKLAVITNT